MPTRWLAIFATTLLATLCCMGNRSAAKEAAAEEAAPHARALGLMPLGIRHLPTRLEGLHRAEERIEAVGKALDWLAAHQCADGKWAAHSFGSWYQGKEIKAAVPTPDDRGKHLYDVGVTGLALSAMICAGHTHADGGAYAKALDAGLRFLIKGQDAEGGLAPRNTQQYIYNHAFATYALVKAYLLTLDPRLHQPAQRAIDFLERARNPHVAWRYGIRPGDNDTSITATIGLSLATAWHAGERAREFGLPAPLRVPDASLRGAMVWIDRIVDKSTGRAGYLTRGTGSARPQEMLDKFPADRTASATAEALALRHLVPAALYDEEAWAAADRKATRVLLSLPPVWDVAAGRTDLYYWYYGTVALSRIGGEAFATWDRAVADAFLGSQRTDTDLAKQLGSWNPDSPWGADGGRVYSTAIGVLCLCAPEHRTPRDRLPTAILARLGDEQLAAPSCRTLLAALKHFRPEGAAQAAAPYLKHTDARVRALAIDSVAQVGASAAAQQACVRALHDKDPAVVGAGLRALARHVPVPNEAIAPCQAALTAAHRDHRRHAAAALERAGAAAQPALEALRTAIGDKDRRTRVYAAGAVLALAPGDEAAAAALRRCVKGKRGGTRAEAALRLASIPGAIDPEARADAYAAGISADDPAIQARALDGLLALDEAQIKARWKALLPAVQHGGRALRLKALKALARVHPSRAAPYIYGDMGSLSPTIRAIAAEAAAAVTTPRPELAALLGRSLAERDPRLRRGAKLGLVGLGADAVGPLRDALAGASDVGKLAALEALTELGELGAPALGDVLRIVSYSTSPTLRAAGIDAIGALGIASEAVVDVLLTAVRDRPKKAAREVRALLQLAGKSEQAADAVEKVMNNPKLDGATRAKAMKALFEAGRLDVPDLIAGLGRKPEALSNVSIELLAGIGKPVLRKLLKQLKTVGDSRRRAAMAALGRMGPVAKSAVKPLIEIYREGRNRDTWYAADALVGIGKPAVKPLIGVAKKQHGQPLAWTVQRIGQIGPDAKAAIPFLKRLRRHEHPKVVDAAHEALGRIDP